MMKSKESERVMLKALKMNFARKLDKFEGDFERALRALDREIYKDCDKMCYDYQVKVH